MSDEKALVVSSQMEIADVIRIGETMAKSGFFTDAKDANKAIVKILAGQELGFGPFASMVGINIIKGKPTISGNLMAAAVKRHPRYSYQVVTMEDDVCELAFFEGKRELGRSPFTMQNAIDAETGRMVAPGAKNSMIKRFARNMLFNRAMSNGVRWYCPDVFMGSSVYTPDEMGAEVDAEGEMVNITPTVVQTTTETTTEPDPHWIDMKTNNDKPVRAMFWAWVKDKMGMEEPQVYEALGVDRIHDYAGTMGEAKTVITKWKAKHIPFQWTEEAVQTFLQGTREDGLTDEWVMETLKVEGLAYYTGTPGEAMAEINKRIQSDIQEAADQKSALEFGDKLPL